MHLLRAVMVTGTSASDRTSLARGCAYLAFAMADRRELLAERLLAQEIMAQDRQTRSMELNPYAG